MDDAVYLIYRDYRSTPGCFIWYAGSSWWSGWMRRYIDQNDTEWVENMIGSATMEQCWNDIGPNYSRISWPSCAECGAISYLDFLCSECRSDSVNLTVE